MKVSLIMCMIYIYSSIKYFMTCIIKKSYMYNLCFLFFSFIYIYLYNKTNVVCVCAYQLGIILIKPITSTTTGVNMYVKSNYTEEKR